MEILLDLQRMGIQSFIATHDYAILKELDLRRKKQDEIAFHALHRVDGTGELRCHTGERYLAVDRNAIAEAFSDLYDREVERSLHGFRR